MTSNAELMRLISPFAGKTGVFHSVASIEHDVDGSFITKRVYHVYKDGIMRESFAYSIGIDDEKETERDRKKALHKAKKVLEILVKEEVFEEFKD